VCVFSYGIWLAGFGRMAMLPYVLGAGTGSDRAGTAPFRVAGTGWLVKRAATGIAAGTRQRSGRLRHGR
jgi:hypothetical protein